MAVGVVVEQALAEPDDSLETEIVLEAALNVFVGRSGIAIGVQKALLGRHDRARSVAVDRSTFKHPIGL